MLGAQDMGKRTTMQQYALTLDLLLHILQSHQQTQQVWALVPAEVLPTPALKGRATRGTLCRVSLDVSQGQVLSCMIRDQQERVLLEGPKALACVRSCEQVVWTVQIQPSASGLSVAEEGANGLPSSVTSLAGPMPWSARPPPRLAQALDARLLEAVSRKQRRLLLLINGERSAADLGTMLGMQRVVVESTLHELEALGLITLAAPGMGERGR